MAGPLRTEAIVLRSMRYGEADRILHLYTPDARAGRRDRQGGAQARAAASAAGSSRSSACGWSSTRGAGTCYGDERRDGRAHARLREHAGALDARGARCDAVAPAVRDRRAAPEVFNLLGNQLALLDADPSAATPADALAFRLKLLLAAGLRPAAGGLRLVRRERGASQWVLAARPAASSAAPARRPPSRWPRRPTSSWSARSGGPLAETPAAARARSRQAERAIGETVEHHAHVRLRAVAGRASDRRRPRRPRGHAGARTITTRPGRGCENRRHGRRTPPRDRSPRPSPRGAPRWRRRRWLPARRAPSRPGARRRARLRAAHAASARPRPDRPLQGVPAPQAQDPGLRRARGRPLPHAPDPHARGHADLAHGRARARASTRTSSRRSASGHDLGHPPFGHIGEDVARPLPARALRRRLPPLRAVAAGRRRARARRRRAEPQRRRARRHPLPLRPRADAARRSRARIVRIVDRVAYINHDIDDALRAGVLDARRAARRARSPCSARPARARIDTLVHDLVETLRAAGDIVQGEEAGAGDGRAARRSCSSTSTSADAARREHARIERVVRTLFDHYAADPERAARRRRRAGRRPRRSG